MRISSILAAGLLAVSLLGTAIAVGAGKSPSMDAELAAFNERYNAIAANYDVDAFLQLYVDEPLWIAPGKAPVAGLDLPRSTFDFFASNNGSLTHTVDHMFSSDDGLQAVLVGQYFLDVEKVGVKASGTYQFVLEKDGEDWKILTDMYNQHDAE